MVNLIKFLLSLFLRETPPLTVAQPGVLIKSEELKKPASKPAKHLNDGKCEKCLLIFDRYPGFHQGLKNWFIQIQASNPEAHISGAGRGKLEQEEYFVKKTSNAHYGQSAHNFNAAVDIFRLHQNGAEWPKTWFTDIVKPAIEAHNAAASFKIKWYGMPGSAFYELPHCEVDGWKTMGLNLVEPA